MYYPPQEIIALNKKMLNKAFYAKYKRYPIAAEINNMEATGIIKNIEYKLPKSYLNKKERLQKSRDQAEISVLAFIQAQRLLKNTAGSVILKKKTKKEFILEKQVIRSNNERRKKEVLAYHENSKTELSEQMIKVLSKY